MPKKRANNLKETVISFRITAKQQKLLDAIQSQKPVVLIKSRSQYARKVLIDFLEGRFNYKNENDQIGDLEKLT